MKTRFYLHALVVVCLVTGSDFCATDVVAGPLSAEPHPAATVPSEDGAASPSSDYLIPGPLRSFLRMAGISQQVSPDDVLPLLSWSVASEGYQVPNRPTEFLILLKRYVAQARELAILAGDEGVIRVSTCEDAAPLLHVLGYRIVSECGRPGTSLLTKDAERAFLTIDSGFPLTELEQTLQGGKPFEYSFSPTPVRALFAESDWTTASPRNKKEKSMDLVDAILNDYTLARLYWALSKMDRETGLYLQRNIGIRKLLEYGPVLDFYGSHIYIRGGQVLVPGGTAAEPAWRDLAGANPNDSTDFILRLLSKDKGWLAAYFDVLSSLSSRQQAPFTEPRRLRRFYAALRPPDRSVTATKGVFRPWPWLLLLVNQVHWGPNGEPSVPGGVEVWKEMLLRSKETARAKREQGKRYPVRNPVELLEAMFALSRDDTDTGPLQAYLALVNLDSRRPFEHHLSPQTVRLMCLKFADYSDQYRMFSEFPELSDASISLFLDTAEQLGKIPNPVRGNAFGTMQANLGIWQILARQGEIKSAQVDDSWQNVIKPFSRVRSASRLYDAGRTSLAQLFLAAVGKTAISQDGIIELLAGPRQTTPEGKKIHSEMADRIRSVLDGQRLVSLDVLIALGDGLSEKANGKVPEEYLLRLADELHEFEMPQPIFTNSERAEWAASVYSDRHTYLEMRTKVGATLRSTKASPAQLEDARGQLTPFLRDTLVGLNYAYYEPPGAQALHHNPLLVRSHDFSGETVEGVKALWQAPRLFGEGSPAGGGARLVGSLADLPYVLADLEQDFIAPKSVQALIWRELVPSLLTSAVLPRWWNVSVNELHAVALYQRTGEELLTASAQDEQLRGKVMAILSDRVLPRQYEQVEQAIRAGRVSEIIPRMMPADTFYLTAEFERRYPEEVASWGSAGEELRNLCQRHPEEVSWKRLSQDFGVPHPTLSQTYARELLNVPPLPAFSGYASRLLGESWDSSNLYWARLADETGRSPAALNRLVPKLTQRMVERTFATDFEDWPAILRALRETGEEFRQGKIASLTETEGHQP
jgi:hypothetical protein